MRENTYILFFNIVYTVYCIHNIIMCFKNYEFTTRGPVKVIYGKMRRYH